MGQNSIKGSSDRIKKTSKINDEDMQIAHGFLLIRAETEILHAILSEATIDVINELPCEDEKGANHGVFQWNTGAPSPTIIRSTSFGRMMCQLKGGRMKNEHSLQPKAKFILYLVMPPQPLALLHDQTKIIFVMMPIPDIQLYKWN